MATIQVGSAGGKRPVDHEIPLVPFIDLLLCCVMFLLVTAVWSQMGRFSTPIEQGHADATVEPPDGPTLQLHLVQDGFVLGSSLGDHQELPRESGLTQLHASLSTLRHQQPAEAAMEVSVDDGISYDRLIEALDVLSGEGFHDVAVREAH
jgi:biopolymer transport protein ExbD